MIATTVETETSKAHPDIQQPLPSEIVAFCSLIARIAHRCLIEQNATFLALIATTPVDQQQAIECERAA